MIRLLSWLLWLANARARSSGHSKQRYELKDKILRRWGALVGMDVQHIVRMCYACEGAGYWSSDPNDSCDRCGGTGNYDERWIRLERWQLGARVFHRPAGYDFVRPAEGVNVIRGYITHTDVDHDVSAEAFLWLALLCDPRLFFRELMRSRRYPRSMWKRPLLALQTVTFRLHMRFLVRRCSCGRRYFANRNGQMSYYCQPCIDRFTEQSRVEWTGAPVIAADDDDLPF
jgi:hypothetical protein